VLVIVYRIRREQFAICVSKFAHGQDQLLGGRIYFAGQLDTLH
jgi:hypothetical protein